MRSDKLLSRILIFIEIFALAAVVILAVAKTVAPKEEVTYELVERDSESVNSVSELEIAQIKANEGGESGVESDNSQTAGDENSDETNDSVIDMSNRELISISDEAKALVAEMTVEQKVAQLFLTSPETLTSTPKVNAAGDKTKTSITKYPVAGVIYSPSNVENAHQVTTLVANTQKIFEDTTPLSMLIGATTSFGREDFAISNSTGGDAVVQVITAKSFEAMNDAGEIATKLENSSELADGYSLYRCMNLNVASGVKSSNAVDAINNHADLIYVSEDFPAIYEAVLNAVNGNDIDGTQLDEIVSRIITVKLSLPQEKTTIVEASEGNSANRTEAGDGQAANNGGRDREPTEAEVKAALAEYQKALEAQKAEAARKAQAADAAMHAAAEQAPQPATE